MTSLKLCCVVITAWLSVWIPWTGGQGSGPEVVTATVGETVTLPAPVTADVLVFSWYRGPVVLDTQQILTYLGATSKPVTGPQHTGLETGLPDGSLRIRDVTTSYTGAYTVSVTGSDGQRTATRQLRVYDILSQPTLDTSSGSDFNGYNLTLNCDGGNQTVERYQFFKDTLNITCDQQRITCNESSPFLHFHPVTSSDSGDYTCGIYNPVSSNTSRPLEVRVKDPISNVSISSNGTSDRLWENEASINLTCSALGTDPSFSWMYNSSALPEDWRYQLSPDWSSLVIRPVTRRDTGPFVCTASNPANNRSSPPFHLDISLRPSGRILYGAQKVSANHVELSCSWPGGSPAARVQLQLPPSIDESADDEVKHNTSRSNITLGSILSCRGTQEGYTDNSSLPLGLPLDPGFKDNTTLPVTGGKPVTLVVNLLSSGGRWQSSAGILPANFTWFNGTTSIGSGGRVEVTSNVSFSQMVISSVMESDSGDYICWAENLMGTTNFSFRVHVSPAPETSTTVTTTTTTPPVTSSHEEPGGLSAGAIAGIVVAVLVFVVLVGVTVYCLLKKKKDKKQRASNRNDQGDPNVLPMKDTPKKDDVNYAVLKFNNNNQQQMPEPDYPVASETVYAQVKKQ